MPCIELFWLCVGMDVKVSQRSGLTNASWLCSACSVIFVCSLCDTLPSLPPFWHRLCSRLDPFLNLPSRPPFPPPWPGPVVFEWSGF
jgi:hypothetical protein